MNKLIAIFMLAILMCPISSPAETVKTFLDTIDSNDPAQRSAMYNYWKGMLDTTMYTMSHKYIRFEIQDEDGYLIGGKLCLPIKYPSPEEFLAFYKQYINAEIKVKGRGVIEEQMDQVMFQMWLALFNCKRPLWDGTALKFKNN